MIKQSYSNIAIVLVVSVILILVYRCKNPNIDSGYYTPEHLATHFNGEHYVGSRTCVECHEDIYNTHLKTAHYRTSALSDDENILGSFKDGSNLLDLEYVRFTMEQKEDAFYQLTEIKNRTKKQLPSTFDITIGSGTRGQSYATWKDDKLFQLQTSYHTQTDSWVNSPGFPNYADKDRPIRDACLKCHVTFAKNLDTSGRGNSYDRGKIILGIDCEKCHRPSEKHVVYHRKNPEINSAKYMLSLDSLSRQQRLDVCAQCHSGPRNHLGQGNSFSFLSGELLDDYAKNPYRADQEQKLDVHGNQYGLLTKSKCFKETPTMDCTSCHNPHKNQRGDTSHFNQKCVACHTSNTIICSEQTSRMAEMENNCIACHMPVSASQAMKVQLDNTDSLETSFYIRSHLIKIYADEVSSSP